MDFDTRKQSSEYTEPESISRIAMNLFVQSIRMLVCVR